MFNKIRNKIIVAKGSKQKREPYSMTYDNDGSYVLTRCHKKIPDEYFSMAYKNIVRNSISVNAIMLH